MTEKMIRVSETQANILIAIATYKYLCVSQLHRLKVCGDISWIRTKTKELTQGAKPLLEVMNFPIKPRQGKIEHIYFLTKYGKDILIEGLNIHEKDIRLPIGTSTLFNNDYAHRKNTIHFHISLNEWITSTERKYELDFFHCYFDKIGNNRTNANLQSMSKIMIGEDDYIIPDAVFSFTSKERPYLFLFEMYDGKDTGRVIEQVKKHVKAISLASPSEKHNIQYSHRVLLVFEFESMKNAFLDRLNNDLYFSYVYDYFLCKSMEGVQHNFFSDWKNLQGEVRSLI